MYTQCPDCATAFKVTADVLKQAAGKVRCGGCGSPFNALDFLSEKMPDQEPREPQDPALPELKPERNPANDGLPQSISAEQSAALLKTLDELAGSDIRIEDTGVEWRVLDEQEASAPAADDDDADLATEFNEIDEILDDSETPIDEFLTRTPEIVDAPEIFEEAANGPSSTPVDELRFDDNTPLPDDFDLDDESSYLPEARESVEEDNDADDASVFLVDEEAAPEAEESAVEIALSDPDEWQDILGEFQDLAVEVATPAEEIDTGASPMDVDTQFALQAEAMGIDVSGIETLDEDEDNPDEDIVYEDLDVEDPNDEDLDDEPEPEPEDDDDDDDDDDEIGQLELIEDPIELIEEPIVEQHTIEAELDVPGSDDIDADPDDASDEHYVPPMSEEEHTVNMMIDQDLMSFAIEDEDGFASTIVIPEKDAEIKAKEKLEDDEISESEFDEGSGFETIIMEGDYVRSGLDAEKRAADRAAAAELAELARASEQEQVGRSGSINMKLIGGVAALLVFLLAQAAHQYRETLATFPAFSQSVGQIYRAIGNPIQPAWDITGWRFEATKGSADGADDRLTIYSRLGNKSDTALPYPLIAISLTDRFEEIIGSRILDPAEYLPADLDPRKPVEPGNTFNAVITIETSSDEATGFKLNVCYRLSGEQLRCAIDDFK